MTVPPPGFSSPAEAPPPSAAEPWIESAEGGLFFLNAVLAAPALLVLLPLALARVCEGLGFARGTELFSVVPTVAGAFVPWLGWLALLPLVTAAWNLKREKRPLPRALLLAFVLVHGAVLVYTLRSWIVGGTA